MTSSEKRVKRIERIKAQTNNKEWRDTLEQPKKKWWRRKK